MTSFEIQTRDIPNPSNFLNPSGRKTCSKDLHFPKIV